MSKKETEAKRDGVHFFDGKKRVVVMPNGKAVTLPEWLKRKGR